MTESEAIRLFKCLADKSRLQILKSLTIEDMYVERLAERLGISAPTVSFHLKKLADAGAVTSYKSQYYMMYSLNKDIFEVSMLKIIQEESDDAVIQEKRDAEYRQKVIDAFFEYGKLKAIPSQRKKERIVLEVIAGALNLTASIRNGKSISSLRTIMTISVRSAGIWWRNGSWTGMPEATGV